MEGLLNLRLSIIFHIFLAILKGCDADLSCFKCNSISSVQNCDTIVECSPYEKCFIHRAHNSSGPVYTLGCQENEFCPSSQPFSLVGRDLRTREIHDCFECCSSHGCNKHLCELRTDNTRGPTDVSCLDKFADCADRDKYTKICSNTSEAKMFCKMYCNLCHLVDGGWSNWGNWSQCSTTCGLGLESRFRTCSNPYPANGGDLCAGDNIQKQSCFLRTCPDHGGWSFWEEWSPCSSQCGVGLKKRHRMCANPPPSLYGHYCIGDSSDYALCNGTECDGQITAAPSPYTPEVCVDTLGDCTAVNQSLGVCADREHAKTVCRQYCGLCFMVDGGWAEWTEWSSCSTTCDSGVKGRVRSCTNPTPADGGKDCVGSAKQISPCFPRNCPVHGDWSVWSEWSTCSATCGMGLTHKRRTCDNPRPSYDGNFCFGDPVEYNLCTLVPCSVNGGWASWGSWTTCSATCGRGIHHRSRTCTNPSSDNGGKYCDGDSSEYTDCQIRSCEVNGGWTSWGSWTNCSATCGKGIHHRSRTCTNPSPANNGKYCDGDPTEYTECQITSCEVTGGWASWGLWSACSSSCGMGIHHMSRTCTNPTPANGGKYCDGDSSVYMACQISTCEECGGIWMCFSLGYCQVNGAWTTWGSWGTCSATCGVGIRQRTRICSNPAPANGGKYCDGEPLQYNECDDRSCAVDGSWSLWTPWSQCYSDIFPCDVGTQNATRTCTYPAPANGGKYCDGNSIMYRQCDAHHSCFASVNHLTIRVVSGRLEVYYNHTWGTVCGERFDDIDATVACKMLGYSKGWKLSPISVPDGTGPIWLDNLGCHGTELDLFHCLPSTQKIGENRCHHNSDVGVRCAL